MYACTCLNVCVSVPQEYSCVSVDWHAHDLLVARVSVSLPNRDPFQESIVHVISIPGTYVAIAADQKLPENRLGQLNSTGRCFARGKSLVERDLCPSAPQENSAVETSGGAHRPAPLAQRHMDRRIDVLARQKQFVAGTQPKVFPANSQTADMPNR